MTFKITRLFCSILFYLALNSNVILNRQMRFLYYLKNIQTNDSRRLRNQRNRSFIVCRNPSWLQQRLSPSWPSHHFWLPPISSSRWRRSRSASSASPWRRNLAYPASIPVEPSTIFWRHFEFGLRRNPSRRTWTWPVQKMFWIWPNQLDVVVNCCKTQGRLRTKYF